MPWQYYHFPTVSPARSLKSFRMGDVLRLGLLTDCGSFLGNMRVSVFVCWDRVLLLARRTWFAFSRCWRHRVTRRVCKYNWIRDFCTSSLYKRPTKPAHLLLVPSLDSETKTNLFRKKRNRGFKKLLCFREGLNVRRERHRTTGSTPLKSRKHPQILL